MAPWSRVFSAAMLLLVACRGGEEEVPGTIATHPIPSMFVPGPEPVRISLSGRRISGAIPIGHPIDTIGALELPADEVFGTIGDIAIDSAGRILVLDTKASEVRVFSSAGGFLYRIGRPGRGPGELSNPQSLTVSANSELFVGDLTRQIHVFRLRSDSGVYQRSLRVAVSPLSMCFMHDRIWFHGMNLGDTTVIHVITPLDTTDRSFGRVYRSPTSIINYVVSRGRITCDAPSATIVYVPSSVLGRVLAYDTAGSTRWIAAFDGFRPAPLYELANEGYASGAAARGAHRIATVLAMPGSWTTIQVAFSEH